MLPPSIPPPDVLAGVDDLIRSSLEGFADVWFIRLLVFTALVFLGLVFEAPEIWHETVGSLRRLCRRPAIKRELHPLAKLAGTVGWFLIVVGVAGELVAEGFLFKADGLVVKFDEILLADTTKSAGAAHSSAIKAADAAKVAKDQSEAAVSSASKALDLAKGARKEADSFESKIDDARKMAGEAKSQITDAFKQATAATEELNRLKTPRSLTNIPAFLAAMKSFPGTEFSFSGVFGDQESKDLASAIGTALQDAGWKPVLPPYAFSIGPPHFKLDNFPYEVQLGIRTGVSIEIEADKTPEELNVLPLSLKPSQAIAAFALRDALSKSIRPSQDGLAASKLEMLADPNFRKPEFKSVLIEVGKKP